MNCHKYCEHLPANKGMWRPHFTCLSCWFRRYFYGKLNPDKFYLVPFKKKVVFVCTSHSPYGLPVPRKYSAYFLFMNMDHSQWWLTLRNGFVKTLLTIVEFVVQL